MAHSPLACTRQATRDAASTAIGVPGTRLRLPTGAGWIRDRDIPAVDARMGGTALRLVRPGSVIGSPRIEVVLAPRGTAPPILEDFLTRSLRAMGELENSGQIHILRVDQKRTTVGEARAYRVQHEYITGQGHGQVSLYSVSIFVVLDGQEICVTATGRTELFHPLGGAIDAMLGGLHAEGMPVPAGTPDGAIDLGRVGGGT